MPPKVTIPSFTESDESDISDNETNSQNLSYVLLGFADGPITSQADLKDGRLSKIGGMPTSFLTNSKQTSPTCKLCQSKLSFLLQIYCPLSDDEVQDRNFFDRALHIWHCAKPSCIGKPGSVTAIRTLAINIQYKKQLEKSKTAKQEPSSLAPKQSLSNPFSSSFTSTSSSPSNPFASNSSNTTTFNNPFAKPKSTETASPSPPDISHLNISTTKPSQDENQGQKLDSEENENATRKPKQHSNLHLEPAEPVYEPIYLATEYEDWSSVDDRVNLSSETKRAIKEYEDEERQEAEKESSYSKKSLGKKPSLAVEKETGSQENSWSGETYEVQKMANVDQAFLEFCNRLSRGGSSQCIRYEWSGKPLPLTCKDETYSTMFPLVSSSNSIYTQTTVTRPGHASAQAPAINSRARVYDPSKLPTCSNCGSKRTFEIQLMPNILSQLKTSSNGTQIELGWTTAFVFVCANDCIQSDQHTWLEELVLLQHD